MKCALYARSATTDKACEIQLRELRAYVERMGWVVVAMYVDTGSSGVNSARPQLARLMGDAKGKQFDLVLVWSFDRWGRSLPGCIATIEQLYRAGIGWTAVSQGLEINRASPLAALIEALRGWGAESKRERVRAGMIVAKRRDQTAGRPKLIFNRELVKSLRADGKSIREIAAKLKISYGTVRGILAE